MDVAQSKNRSIYLYCHPNFNAFFIYDNSAKEWIITYYENVYNKKNLDTNELKVWLSRNMSVFNSSFDEVIIAVDSEKFVLVPDDFEEDKKIALLSQFQNPVSNDEVVLSQSIGNESVVYTISKEFYEVLNSHFENKEFIYGDTGLIHYSKMKPGTVVAQIYGNSLSVAYHHNETLQYYNRFVCNHTNDFLYFLLLAFKTLELDSHKDVLLIGGLIEENAPLYKEIWAYIENVEIISTDLTQKKDIPGHYFFNMLNLTQ